MTITTIGDYHQALKAIQEYHERPYRLQVERIARMLGCHEHEIAGEVARLQLRAGKPMDSIPF